MDERRVVTVVFADLVGFTSLGEGLDPEQLTYLVDRCFEHLADDVTSFGGRVDKVVGDAIVALFGAPISHEDDAERAVRAALRMQASMAGLSEEIGAPLRLRAGVNTGEVLVGASRADGDYTAMGDVVNVASRLQTMAAPGEVLVGLTTHAATADGVRFGAPRHLSARGRGGSVDAWVALELLHPPGRRPTRTAAPLVGREEEMGLLCNAVATAVRRHRPQFILLFGEPGVGKSRLAEELARNAANDLGATVLTGRCPPYGEANPWWPLAQPLREACGIQLDDSAEISLAKCKAAVAEATGLSADSRKTARLVAGISFLLGEPSALREVDPERARDEARRSVFAFLDALALRSPVVMVIHALQWADPLVLETLSQLLRRPRHLPLVLVATGEPDTEELWHAAAASHNEVVLHVDPLDRQATSDLLASLAGQELPRELSDILLDRSGGNPLFLEELMALLDDEGLLTMGTGDEHAGVPTPRSGSRLALVLGATELPATLRGLVSARLDTLAPEARALLEDASVIGREGSLRGLAALARARGVDEIASMSEDLATKDQLVIEDGRWRFRSELAREVSYETLTKAARSERHRHVASWLAELGRSTDREDEFLERMAHHYSRAAELEAEIGGLAGASDELAAAAVDHGARAAHRAMERSQFGDAIRMLDRSLKLLPAGGTSETRSSLLLDRAESRAGRMELAAAREDLEAARGQAAPAEQETVAARSLAVLGQVEQVEGAFPEAIAHLEEARSLWLRLGARHEAAAALGEIGMTRFLAGEPGPADASISEALESFRALGNRRREAWALWNLAWIAHEQGQLERAERRLNQASDAFQESGDWRGEGWAKGLLAYVRFHQGRRDEAEAIASAILEEAQDSSDNWAVAMIQLLLADVRLWAGRPDQALAPVNEARRLFAELGDRRGENRAQAVLCDVLVASGRLAEAMALDGAEGHDDQVVSERDPGERAPESTGPYQRRAVGAPPEPPAEDPSLAFGLTRAFLAAGDAPQALAILERVAGMPRGAGLGALGIRAGLSELGSVEWQVLHSRALLALGQTSEPVAALRLAASSTRTPGPRANALATLAAALSVSSSPGEAPAPAEEVLGMPEATYLDLATAHLALASCRLRLGQRAAGEEALDRAAAVAGATTDVLLAASVRLARAALLEASGHRGAEHGEPVTAGTAGDELASARSELAALGASPEAWENTWRTGDLGGVRT